MAPVPCLPNSLYQATRVNVMRDVGVSSVAGRARDPLRGRGCRIPVVDLPMAAVPALPDHFSVLIDLRLDIVRAVGGQRHDDGAVPEEDLPVIAIPALPDHLAVVANL